MRQAQVRGPAASAWLRAGILLLAAAGSGRGARGQEPAAVPAEADQYRIAAGDTIAVTVVGRRDLSTEVRVPRGGDVILPGAGVVQCAGLGVEELAGRIAALLEANERLRTPKVLVSVVSYGAKKAYVYGAVTTSSAVELPAEAPMTLMQAIASCGGFAPAADRGRVRIVARRPGQAPGMKVVDARAVAEGTAPEADEILRPGDMVFVPGREPVYVLGEVNRQGQLNVPSEYPLTVSKAIAMSGGFTPYARETRVRVTRRSAAGTESSVVNVANVLADGALEKDMALRPGDIVYVPERMF